MVLVWRLIHHILGRIVTVQDMVPLVVVNHRHWHGILLILVVHGGHDLNSFVIVFFLVVMTTNTRMSFLNVGCLLLVHVLANVLSLLLVKWSNHGLMSFSELVSNWYSMDISMDNFMLISVMRCFDSFRRFDRTVHDWLFNNDIVGHLAEIQLFIVPFLMVRHCLKDAMLMEVHRLNVMLIVIVMVKLVMCLVVHSMELLISMMPIIFLLSGRLFTRLLLRLFLSSRLRLWILRLFLLLL